MKDSIAKMIYLKDVCALKKYEAECNRVVNATDNRLSPYPHRSIGRKRRAFNLKMKMLAEVESRLDLGINT